MVDSGEKIERTVFAEKIFEHLSQTAEYYYYQTVEKTVEHFEVAVAGIGEPEMIADYIVEKTDHTVQRTDFLVVNTVNYMSLLVYFLEDYIVKNLKFEMKTEGNLTVEQYIVMSYLKSALRMTEYWTEVAVERIQQIGQSENTENQQIVQNMLD